MYPTCILMGVSQSIFLNTAVNLIAEVVGTKGGKGAIVYGAYSFFDKMSSGLTLYFIMVLKQHFPPNNISKNSALFNLKNVPFIRICVAIIPGISALCAFALVWTGSAADYKDDKGEDTSDLVCD